jgi:uncharacterized protein YaiE (UPF0345 family)
LIATSADINGGTIDGVTIGGASAGAGTFTTVTASGEIAANGGIALGDNDKATFGASDDLQIYHDGTNSYIKDAGTGTLNLQSSDTIRLQTSDGAGGFQNVFAGVDEGAAFLYYDGADKLATTATGIDVTGTVTASNLLNTTNGLTFQGNSGTPTSGAFLHRPSANTLVLGTASTERLRITSSGNVGIGTTSPSEKLEVVDGSIDLSLGYNLQWDGGLTSSNPIIWASSDGNSLRFSGGSGSESMRIDSSGNVLVSKTTDSNAVTGVVLRDSGTGTFVVDGNYSLILNRLTSDGTIIDLRKDSTAVGSIGTDASKPYFVDSFGVGISINRYNGESALLPYGGGDPVDGAGQLGDPDNRWKDLYLSGGVSNPAAGGTLTFGTAGSERMRIDSSGNVGIGTSSTAGRLHTVGSGNTGGAVFQVDGTTTSVSGNTSVGAFPHCLSLYNSDTSQNNNIASLGFSVSTTGATSNAAIAAYSTAAGAMALTFHTESGNVIGERMRIDSSGNLLVGTTSPTSSAITTIRTPGASGAFIPLCCEVGITSDGFGAISFVNPAGQQGTIAINTSSVSYNTSSDYRLKNITGPITNSGEYIDSLNPVEGTWKADGSTFVGLIAHEVQEVSRTSVATGEKDGEEMQGMDYSSAEIIANLIAEVKALRQRVATLESN